METENQNLEVSSEWECKICLNGLKNPICTTCGHLFCWPCLYKWLKDGPKCCPTCKSTVLSINNNKHMIAVYSNIEETEGRTSSSDEPLDSSSKNDKIPPCPHRVTSTTTKMKSRSEMMDELLVIFLHEGLYEVTLHHSREEMAAMENRNQKIEKVKEDARLQMITILVEAKENFMRIFDG